MSDNSTKDRLRIGERIREIREQLGMTQEQLADKAGMTRYNIIRIEAGKYSTGQDILSRIATVLGKRLDIV